MEIKRGEGEDGWKDSAAESKKENMTKRGERREEREREREEKKLKPTWCEFLKFDGEVWNSCCQFCCTVKCSHKSSKCFFFVCFFTFILGLNQKRSHQMVIQRKWRRKIRKKKANKRSRHEGTQSSLGTRKEFHYL
jgi:hypothetical protein